MPDRLRVAFAPTCALALLGAAGLAQERALVEWRSQGLAVRPAPRHSHAMAWDAGRQRVVLFGGRNGTFVFGTTWEFDGVAWTQRFPVHAPLARFDAGMAYDRVRQRIVMFGGASIGALGDTWEWDGTDWTQVVTAHAPSPRRLHVMVFDEARGVTMLFGGGLGGTGTWTYDGVDWTAHSVADPGSRDGAAAAYSPYTSRVLLFGGNIGGQERDDLWQWDGVAWTQLAQSVRPPASVYHVMAYDRDLGGMLLHGMPTGSWFWNGHWQQLTGTVPLRRSASAMVHMDSLRRTLLFGGAGLAPYPTVLELDDHWETRFAASQTGYGAGCGVPPLSLWPSPVEPRLGSSWRPQITNLPSPGLTLLAIGLSRTTFAGAPLPLSLAPLGMPGCELLQDTAFALGMPATPIAGAMATVELPIPPVAVLAGYRVYAQAWALAPAANPAGLITSSALAVVIGS